MSESGIKLALSEKTANVVNEFIKEKNKFKLGKFVEWCRLKGKSIDIIGEVSIKLIEKTFESGKDINKSSLEALNNIHTNLTNLLATPNITDGEKDKIYDILKDNSKVIEKAMKRADLNTIIIVGSVAGTFVIIVLGYAAIKARDHIANTVTVSYKFARAIKNFVSIFK